MSAAFVEPPRANEKIPPVEISWQDGAKVSSNDKEADSLLSKSIGRHVYLTTARPKSISVERLDPLAAEEIIIDIGHLMTEKRFADYAAIHIVTTATLARLAEFCPKALFDERRFRSNLVVETRDDQHGFIENEWVGHHLVIGDEVRLRVTDPTPRCSVPTLAQAGLPKDTKILRTIADQNRLPDDLLE